MKSCWKKLLACATALCVSLTGFGLSFCAESDDERLQRVEGDASAEITRVECCGSMNPQYVEAGTALEDLSFTLSVWFEGEVDASGYYEVIPEEITGYDPSEGVKYLTIAVTIQGKPYEFHTDVIVLSTEEYRKNQEIHWFIWEYYMHVIYAAVTEETRLDRFENWTVGNFNYDGRITPENVDTLFTHAYFTEYSANGSAFWQAYFDDETNDFIIPRADMEKMFAKVFTGSPEGLTAAAAYHPETDTFQYGAQGYGGGGPGRYTYEESLDSDGNTVIRYIPEFSYDCVHCCNPTYTCYHNIELVLAPDGRMVSIKLLPLGHILDPFPRTIYQVGEPFDVADAMVCAVYEVSDLYGDKRSEALLPLTADMISGYDPNKIGQQTLTFSYQDTVFPLEVTVTEEEATGWSTPSPTTYEQGEPLDVAGGYLTIGYGNNPQQIPITADMVSGYDPNKLGKQTLTVSYKGKPVFTYEVTVLSHEDYRAEQFDYIIACCYCFSGYYGTPDWHPDTMRFAGKLTEANQEAFLSAAWFLNWGLVDYETVDKDLVAEPIWGSGHVGYFYKFSADDMRRLLDATLVYDAASLAGLSYYREDADCFLIPYTDGWGGPGPELKKYATITQKENGNWLIQQRKPSPDVGVIPDHGQEIYQFDAEFTADYRLVSFEIIMEKLTWKTPPAKTVYEKGEALDLSGAVITAPHGTGKSFDIPVTPDMVSGYDPEKTGKQTLTVTYGGRQITFDVTVAAEAENTPPIAIDDEKTGIKLETDDGVVPPDTVIQAEPVTEGGNFTIVNDALAQTSRKWVAYDISLLSDNVKIQPSGKVKITMPVPRGMNKAKMALFHVAEDGTLTQIPFALDETKDHLIFETDHFSLYAVAETDDANPSTGDGGQGALPWVAGLLLLTGAAILLMRKRPAVR